MGINEELAAIEQRVHDLAVEIGMADCKHFPTEAVTVKDETDDENRWIKAATAIDLFRKKVSEYYGFEREKIIPVHIGKLHDPLYSSSFRVEGLLYEVVNTRLTCLGEL